LWQSSVLRIQVFIPELAQTDFNISKLVLLGLLFIVVAFALIHNSYWATAFCSFPPGPGAWSAAAGPKEANDKLAADPGRRHSLFLHFVTIASRWDWV